MNIRLHMHPTSGDYWLTFDEEGSHTVACPDTRQEVDALVAEACARSPGASFEDHTGEDPDAHPGCPFCAEDALRTHGAPS